jgi:hypothetical protein
MQTTEQRAGVWPDGKSAYTKTWWVTFTNGTGRCFEGEPDDVEQRATTIGAVKSIRSLPYPAEPREQPYRTTEWDGKQVACPSFCYSPKQCQGRTSCPKNYACSE